MTSYHLEDSQAAIKGGFTRIVNFQHRQPLARKWGDGTLSSSDGQRFPISVKARNARALPRYFGYGRGLTSYSWTSSELSQYGSKITPATDRDATYVLDEILGNETELPLLEHTTDIAGHKQRVSGTFDLLGRVFSPRRRDLDKAVLYCFPETDMRQYPRLKGRFKGVVKSGIVLKYWTELWRLAGSLKLGWVSASLLL
ncbi:MAG: Tn3 family transposase [Candidatus Schekmanbacteria bacterium]|nr:Tn3 family transposase [Candidatus Schekmanbacteria bacterium]